MTAAKTINDLVKFLNYCRNEYYNNNNSPISDEEYDRLFDELKQLEDESGIILSNSPTQQVGYEVVSGLSEVKHNEPLLSLDKTKTFEGVISFCNNKPVLFMHKLDGLTTQLTYENGKLIRAETRGDGVTGEDITHNIKTVLGVPSTIKRTGTVRVTGEVIVRKDTFDRINENLSGEDKYKSPRNFASGSIRQLDSSICAKRGLEFIVWNANSLSTDGSMLSGLLKAVDEGFNIVHTVSRNITPTEEEMVRLFRNMKSVSEKEYLPIDGIVIMFNDIEYGKSLGKTAHHFKNGIAYKFYDEGYVTRITDIEFTIGKTGVLTPTAVFEPVDIEGVTVTRASVHNISIIETLNLCIGDEVEVYRANDVIPQIRKNNTIHVNNFAYSLHIPQICPYCGANTLIIISKDSNVKTLECSNSSCSGVLLKRLCGFVSKQALDIEGLSEKTLDKFIKLGYIKDYKDIYLTLPKYWVAISRMEGFGEKSVELLSRSIEKSKETTLDRFIMSLNIDGIGSQNAKELSKQFNNDAHEFEKSVKNKNVMYNKLCNIKGFGDVLISSILDWFDNDTNLEQFEMLIKIFKFKQEQVATGTKLENLKFVITGSLNFFNNRDSLIEVIKSEGGNVQSGVNKDTNYLINNDVNSNSSKNKKAKELGVPIISEEQFIELLDNNSVKTKSKRKGLF